MQVTAATPETSFALKLAPAQYRAVITHCLTGIPNEACGLFTGPWANGMPTGDVSAAIPCENADASAMTFTIAPKDLLKAMRKADEVGEDIVGTWHSHTHTDAYPSPTDVRQAVDPNWTYVIVSLAFGDPVVRGYHIRDGEIVEVPVVRGSD